MNLNKAHHVKCPDCKSEVIEHKFFTLDSSLRSFGTKNGWYCSQCNYGPFQIGCVSKSKFDNFALKTLDL